ncbi:hypothetical protein D9M73_167310 [compost metagenome]
MSDRQYRQASVYRQSGTAAREFADLAKRHAGAFRKDQYPDVLFKQLVALAGDLLQGGLGVVAIDGDRPQHGHGPAEERHVQQFTLEHLAQGREIGGKEKGFPGALVVGEDHAGLLGDVLSPGDLDLDVEKHPYQHQRKAAPVDVDKAISGAEWQKRRDKKAQGAPQQGAGTQQQVKKKNSDRLQDRHSGMYRCGLARLVKVRLVRRRPICG